MNTDVPLYPLKFEPIFKSMLWGGDRLRPLLGRPSSIDEPIGEAWIVSDVGDDRSRVSDGPLAGATLHDLMEGYGDRLLGPCQPGGGRFPLLLKLLDARKPLSVQVHPDDEQAEQLTNTPDARGKTEAWVILEAQADSQIYAGLKPGVDAAKLRRALENNTAANLLHTFQPAAGDCVFLQAGTVHAIGAGLMLFEVQQTSDITYRLYDWNRVDARTGKPRQLHIAESMACTDFERGPVGPVEPEVADGREKLVDCEYFSLSRLEARRPFPIGSEGRCRVYVGVGGSGTIEHGGISIPIGLGDAVLVPAEVGVCQAVPVGDLCLLECGLPERAANNSGKVVLSMARRAG